MNRRVKLEKHKYDLEACIEFIQISEKSWSWLTESLIWALCNSLPLKPFRTSSRTKSKSTPFCCSLPQSSHSWRMLLSAPMADGSSMHAVVWQAQLSLGHFGMATGAAQRPLSTTWLASCNWGLRLQILTVEASNFEIWGFEASKLEAWGFKIWRFRLQNLTVEAWGLRLQNLTFNPTIQHPQYTNYSWWLQSVWTLCIQSHTIVTFDVFIQRTCRCVEKYSHKSLKNFRKHSAQRYFVSTYVPRHCHDAPASWRGRPGHTVMDTQFFSFPKHPPRCPRGLTPVQKCIMKLFMNCVKEEMQNGVLENDATAEAQ